MECLLRRSGFVSLHIFLSDATRHLINGERLALIKNRRPVLSTRRGQNRRQGGALLGIGGKADCGRRPPVGQIRKRLLAPPRIGGATADTRRLPGLMAAENLIRSLMGEQPEEIVNPELLRVLQASAGILLPFALYRTDRPFSQLATHAPKERFIIEKPA
jgi:hypothetical protein